MVHSDDKENRIADRAQELDLETEMLLELNFNRLIASFHTDFRSD